MWRSIHARITGPSLSRKNRLSAVNDRKAASEASAVMPVATPPSSAWKASLTEELALSPALCALASLTPASFSALCSLSTALLRLFSSSGPWLVTPDSSRTAISTASAITPNSTIAAPPARPTRWRASQPHDRREHRGDDPGRDDRDDDDRRQREQPDDAGEQDERADEQPRHEAHVAEPLRDGDDAGVLVDRRSVAHRRTTRIIRSGDPLEPIALRAAAASSGRPPRTGALTVAPEPAAERDPARATTAIAAPARVPASTSASAAPSPRARRAAARQPSASARSGRPSSRPPAASRRTPSARARRRAGPRTTRPDRSRRAGAAWRRQDRPRQQRDRRACGHVIPIG